MVKMVKYICVAQINNQPKGGFLLCCIFITIFYQQNICNLLQTGFCQHCISYDDMLLCFQFENNEDGLTYRNFVHKKHKEYKSTQMNWG